MNPFQVLRHNRGFVALAFALFVGGMVLGFLFSEPLYHLLSSMVENIRQLGKQVMGKGPLAVGGMIFLNNVRVCLGLVVLGTFFAIPSILGILLNGAMLGFLFHVMGQGNAAVTVLLFIFGILPHGMFEIPAFVMAGAFGIKAGYALMQPLAGKTRWGSFVAVWREIFWVAPVIILLLLLAAGIESFVTPVLLERYVS